MEKELIDMTPPGNTSLGNTAYGNPPSGNPAYGTPPPSNMAYGNTPPGNPAYGNTFYTQQPVQDQTKKYCQHCGSLIDKECVVCPVCGKQVSQLKQDMPQQIIIQNQNTNSNVSNSSVGVSVMVSPKSKVTALLLCLFVGILGVHRFYVGKIGTGILWLFTGGLFGIGVIIDFFVILFGGFRDANGMFLK